MENQTYDLELLKLARQRVRFFPQVVTYVLVNSLLVFIWAFTHWHRPSDILQFRHFWPIWSIVFWGIGLAARFVSLFVIHEQ
jgi:hypothetical protein